MEQDQKLQVVCERVRLRVKPHNWQAFWFTTVEGEPVAEVARRLGMTKEAVTVARHRVIKMIRSAVEVAAGGDECVAAPPGGP
jgi:RNA polymerase sigma-70 factor (ECF subfamily)